VPTSTMAANTPAVTRIWRGWCSIRDMTLSLLPIHSITAR
jgi:hypothetical protein